MTLIVYQVFVYREFIGEVVAFDEEDGLNIARNRWGRSLPYMLVKKGKI